MPPAPKTRFEPLTVKKVVADVTKKIYTTYLNKTAEGGYPTVDSLIAHPTEVLALVKATPPERQKTFMNAIFYAVSDHPNEHKKEYYNFFQTLKKKDPKYQAYQAVKEEEAKKAEEAPKPEVKQKRKYVRKAKVTPASVPASAPAPASAPKKSKSDQMKSKRTKIMNERRKKLKDLLKKAEATKNETLINAVKELMLLKLPRCSQ